MKKVKLKVLIPIAVIFILVTSLSIWYLSIENQEVSNVSYIVQDFSGNDFDIKETMKEYEYTCIMFLKGRDGGTDQSQLDKLHEYIDVIQGDNVKVIMLYAENHNMIKKTANINRFFNNMDHYYDYDSDLFLDYSMYDFTSQSHKNGYAIFKNAELVESDQTNDFADKILSYFQII